MLNKLIHIVIKISVGFLCVILLIPSLVVILGAFVGQQIMKLGGTKKS